MQVKSLYKNPQLYDAECSKMMNDKKFWKNMINAYLPKTILEVGCGTGRVASYIINNIEEYIGIDISHDFLKYFKNKKIYLYNSNKIKLYERDIINTILDKKVNMIILSSQFLGHIYLYSDFIQIFANLKKMLLPDGKIIIDYCNPDLRFLEYKKEYNYCYEFQYKGNVKVYERNKYNQNTQINYEDRKYIFENGQELKQIIPFRIYFPQELDALLELQKLHIDYKYGDYSGGNFKDYCVKQLYVLSPN